MALADYKKLRHRGTAQYFCTVLLKGVELPSQNIKSVVVRESVLELLPKLDLIFLDNGMFTEQFPLEDYDEIEVTFGKNSELEPPISNLKFTLQDWEFENIDKEKVNVKVVRLTGLLKVDKLFSPIKNNSFGFVSSKEYIESIMDELGVDVEYTSETSDIMKWLQINMSDYDMINHITDYSFKEDNNVMFSYFTRNNKFNYCDLKYKIENKKVTSVFYDIVKSLEYRNDYDGEDTQKADIDDGKIYFNDFKYNNIGGYINKKLGYGIEYSIYSLDGEETNNVIDSDEHPLTIFSNKNKNKVGNITDKFVYGYSYESDNVHDNYYKSCLMNKYLKENFFNSPIAIYVNVNSNINLFDKINISIPQNVSDNGTFGINESLSGEYLIGNIIHQVGQGERYKMILVCYRNGFNKNSFMEDSEWSLNE